MSDDRLYDLANRHMELARYHRAQAEGSILSEFRAYHADLAERLEIEAQRLIQKAESIRTA